MTASCKGYLHITGRKKDIIIRNGNNLSAVAIEKKALSLPRVRDVAVVGIRDEAVGEVPVMAAVTDGSCTQEELRGMLGAVLTKIEMPAAVIFLNEMPLLSNGKVDKETIRKQFEKRA